MGRAMSKRSVTLDKGVAAAVDHHVAAGAADSFSAAINEAAAVWAANRDLRTMLDETYEADPESRPSAQMIDAAGAVLREARARAAE